MTLLPRLEGAEERMDAPDVDRVALEQALGHVAAVNRWLGGRRALLRHLHDALPAGRGRILDVGTGSADLPVAMAEWARDRGRRISITAVDAHEATLAVASRRTEAWPEITVGRANGLALPFPAAAFDLAVLSMTLHHMEGEDRIRILQELGRVARGGVVLVGELQRSIPAYLGARLLAATVWARNPVTRHDGPISVLRAFTPAELRELGERAGLRRLRVHRHPFNRLVLRADA